MSVAIRVGRNRQGGGSWMRRRWRRTAAGGRSRAGNETGRGRRRSGTLEVMGSFPTVAED